MTNLEFSDWVVVPTTLDKFDPENENYVIDLFPCYHSAALIIQKAFLNYKERFPHIAYRCMSFSCLCDKSLVSGVRTTRISSGDVHNVFTYISPSGKLIDCCGVTFFNSSSNRILLGHVKDYVCTKYFATHIPS